LSRVMSVLGDLFGYSVLTRYPQRRVHGTLVGQVPPLLNAIL